MQDIVKEAKNRVENVNVKHLNICTCADDALSQVRDTKQIGRFVKNNKGESLCPFHLNNFDLEKITLRSKDMKLMTQLPSLKKTTESPPFTISDKVIVYGTLVGNSPVAGKIIDDCKYWTEGTFKVLLVNGKTLDNVSSFCLAPESKKYESPRFFTSFVNKMTHCAEAPNSNSIYSINPHSLEQTDVIEMIGKYSKLISLNYESSENMAIFYVRRSTLHASTGNYDLALQDASKAIEKDNSLAVAYFRKGCALYGLKDYTLSVTAFQKGLDMDPVSDSLRHALQVAMNSLRQSQIKNKKMNF